MRKIAVLFLLAITACAPASPATNPIIIPTSTRTALSTLTVTVNAPVATVTPEAARLTHESFVCADQAHIQEVCLGLEAKPEMDIATKFMNGWFGGKANDQFWTETIGTDHRPNVEEVREWMEENDWKIPAVSSGGTPFVMLQARGASASGKSFGTFAPNEQMAKVGYIDLREGVRTMFFDPSTWATDAGGVKTIFSQLLILNGKSWPLFTTGSTPKNSVEVGGFLLDEFGKPVFVVGGTNIPEYARQTGDEKYYLGGKGAVSDQIISAWTEALIRALDLDNSDLSGEDGGRLVYFTLYPATRNFIKVPGFFIGDNSWYTVAE